jgi:hypothetical protein
LPAAVGLPQLDRLENLIERLIALQSEMLGIMHRRARMLGLDAK